MLWNNLNLKIAWNKFYWKYGLNKLIYKGGLKFFLICYQHYSDSVKTQTLMEKVKDIKIWD